MASLVDIYTCITAGYDDLKKQPSRRNLRHTAFVEGIQRPLPPWHILPVLSPGLDPTRRARQCKVLAHEVLPHAEYSLWVDGCFVIRPDFRVEAWIDEHMKDADLVTFAHAEHDCTYEHAAYVLKAELDLNRDIEPQMARYRAAGLPEHAGMVQTHVVLRRHNEATARFNEKWWHEIENGSRRDQLSFVYAAKETGLRCVALPVEERRYFHGKSHRGRRAAAR